MNERIAEHKYKLKANLMDPSQVQRTLIRLSHEIIEKNRGVENVCLVGILRRGVSIANTLADTVEQIEGSRIPTGSLDISFYRDDLTKIYSEPMLGATEISFDLNGKDVILVDDVIYTGRTVRAAIDAIFSLGRPKSIQLCVFIDRGLRELPIKPDYVGKNIPTSHAEMVSVKVMEFDGESSVSIYEKEETAKEA